MILSACSLGGLPLRFGEPRRTTTTGPCHRGRRGCECGLRTARVRGVGHRGPPPHRPEQCTRNPSSHPHQYLRSLVEYPQQGTHPYAADHQARRVEPSAAHTAPARARVVDRARAVRARQVVVLHAVGDRRNPHLFWSLTSSPHCGTHGVTCTFSPTGIVHVMFVRPI